MNCLTTYRLITSMGLLGEGSEALAKEAFQRMDVQLDLSMRTAGVLEGWSPIDYQSEYKEILQTLSTGLEPGVIDGHQWYKNNQCLFYEDRIVVPEARLDGCLQWSLLSSGHTGANRSVDFFRQCFHSSPTLTELTSRMQTIVDACGCHASKQSDSRDTGLISSLPIPYCTNSILYVDFIHGLPRFGGSDSCLVVICGLSLFTHVFPCNKKTIAEQTVTMLVEQWFELYGAPKQVHCNEDVRIPGDTGWYKQVEAGSDPRGHLGVTWGVYLCADKPPLADITLSHPPECDRFGHSGYERPYSVPRHRQRRFIYRNIRNQQGFIIIMFP